MNDKSSRSCDKLSASPSTEFSAISGALGRKPPRFSLPVSPARTVASIIEATMRLIGRRSPIGRATIDKYTEDIAVEGQRIQKELGFVPQYDLEDGWRDARQA